MRLAGVVTGLAEFGQELTDPTGNGLVPFDLAGPVAFGGILDELALTDESGA
jgi:hypothetical protein